MSDPALPIQIPTIKTCGDCGHASVYHLGEDMVVGNGPCMIGHAPGLMTYHPCACKEFKEQPPEKERPVEHCVACGGELKFIWKDRTSQWACLLCGKLWPVLMLPVHPHDYATR